MSARAKINAAIGALALLAVILDEALGLGFSETLRLVLYGAVAWVAPSPGRVADRRRGVPVPASETPTERVEIGE